MKTLIKVLFIVYLFIPFFSNSQEKIDLLILNGNYDQALSEIDKMISENPSAAVFLKKGKVFKNQQDYQNALQAFTSGLQYEPQSVDLLSESAECLSVLGNNADAISYYKKATELAPENLVLAGKLGRVYINQKQYREAYEVFSGIYAKDSTNVYWNKQLAYCAFRTFRREEASRLYEKVIEANPRDHGSYINLIHTYNWKKEGDKILATIRKGLGQFPEDAELLLENAHFHYKKKQYDLAMVFYARYLKAEEQPQYEILMNYGISTYFTGFAEDALATFEKLLSMNPNDNLVMYYQSLCHKKMKNFEEAEKWMRWAIEGSTPDYVSEMYHHLGQLLGQQRKYKESVDALEKSYNLNPKKVEVLFEIATTYEEFNSNKTLALNYYQLYLKEAGEGGKNINYALDRISLIKEDLFFEE